VTGNETKKITWRKEITGGVHTPMTYRGRKVEGKFCPYENTMTPSMFIGGPKSFPSIHHGVS
jgi:hypothetical protein